MPARVSACTPLAGDRYVSNRTGSVKLTSAVGGIPTRNITVMAQPHNQFVRPNMIPRIRQIFLIALVSVLTGCAAAPVPTPGVTPSPAATPTIATPPSASTSTAAVATAVSPILLPVEPSPEGAGDEFRTDFSRHTVPYAEILSGGPPKDGIPAIDTPAFVSVAEADQWLRPTEAVVLVQINGEARAYPVQVLTWHEIVNDRVGDVAVSVTYCPLCNTAIVFERTFDGSVLDFGTTGRLRYSNMVMYDRQTETWWQQGTGAGIAGVYAGRTLAQRPVSLIAWADFKTAHPGGKVLSRETGIQRSYGLNPYAGYDNPARQPFLYQGPATPKTLPALARVLTLQSNGDALAISYDALAERRVVTDTVGGQPIVVMWSPGVASPLDAQQVAEGRDVGAALAFARALNGKPLDIVFANGEFTDVQTGSTWSHLGRALSGPLKGEQLAELTAVNHFWFSWAAFYPNTRVWGG
jgi:Protein of unknown function (DUF3179)